MKRLKTLLALALLVTLASCRSFEGLTYLERDSIVVLEVQDAEEISSLSVFAPGLNAISANCEGNNVFNFVRPADAANIPCWYALVPERRDIVSYSYHHYLAAPLPFVQYPDGKEADSKCMLAMTPGFNIDLDRKAVVQKPNSILLPLRIKVTGLEAGERLFSLSFTNRYDVPGLAGIAIFDMEKDSLTKSELRNCHSLSLLSQNGLQVSSDGSVELSAVTFPDFLEYEGGSKIFVSSDRSFYSCSMESVCFDDDVMVVNLADGFRRSDGITFGFNDENLFKTLSGSASSKIIASDGSEFVLEFSEAGCAEKDEDGKCCLRIKSGSYLKIPAVAGKEVTDIMLQLTGSASSKALFNVYSADKFLCSFSASTVGENGGLTALSIEDLPQDLEITNLAGLKIVPATENARIAGAVLTIIDFIDPHKWEDGHIDDVFNNLFDIL